MKNIVAKWILILGFGFSMEALAQQTVEVQASQGLADQGSASQNLYNTAMIHVVVHDDAGPLTNIGSTIGTGYSYISLPPGWSIRTIQVPPGGCSLKPTQFANTFDGHYSIRVLTSSISRTCAWLPGEYHVLIRYEETGFDRSGMAVFEIK